MAARRKDWQDRLNGEDGQTGGAGVWPGSVKELVEGSKKDRRS
jgi:hypothetical protein